MNCDIPPRTRMTFRLTTEVALRRASILRNQGSARSAADWPAKGSRGNLGLKTSLREVWRGGVSLLEDVAEAILAGEVGGVEGRRGGAGGWRGADEGGWQRRRRWGRGVGRGRSRWRHIGRRSRGLPLSLVRGAAQSSDQASKSSQETGWTNVVCRLDGRGAVQC